MGNGAEWYLVEGGKSVGPVTLTELVSRLVNVGGPTAMVYGPGLTAWTPAGQVQAVMAAMRGGTQALNYASPPLPPPVAGDDIDCKIVGEEIQYVEVGLEPGQVAIGEPGYLMYMTSGVQMNTVLGDPSAGPCRGSSAS